ncbi:MAG: hypothetical protein RBR22_12775 [Desulfuromonas sp.]|nr:hypothetical protein [Desulfuromonas sp.]
MKTSTIQENSSSAISTDQLDKYSSALTLSDMEIFIYPELLYSLVLANIMSPVVWRWRDDPWFAGLEKMNPYRRVLRLKQYIMENYDFNLDLDSWGLTSKDTELERFSGMMEPETIAASNALFGYTGDQYYFDMDIRRHFGLDKYAGDIIPYWKTETVEAMDAFCYRAGYARGAGECVSLSTLYAAALFVVAQIPLEDIFLMATPLHSQNFIDLKGGVITNNRRIVTKNMWFNGTELSARAQRALRNEQVTMVAHCSGNIHSVYPQVSIDASAYERFSSKLTNYLHADLSRELLGNFLREHSELQKCFQLQLEHHGRQRWVALEKVYSYEQGSAFRVSNNTRDKLLASIDAFDLHFEPLDGRISLISFEEFFQRYPQLDDPDEIARRLKAEFSCQHQNAPQLIAQLREFLTIKPRLPQYQHKQMQHIEPIVLRADMAREEMIAALAAQRQVNPTVDLAFYAARDMQYCDWRPFIKAAMERSPVVVEATKDYADAELLTLFADMCNESIYSAGRLAQPDEVWNFQRGDGVERAFCLANIWKKRHPEALLSIDVTPHAVQLTIAGNTLEWPSSKGLVHQSTC